MKFFLYLLVALQMLGCNVSKDLTQKWTGKTAQELVVKEGPPARKTSDENGGQIYIYEKTRKGTVSKGANGRSWTETAYFLEKTMYYVNAEGKIYNVLFTSDTL